MRTRVGSCWSPQMELIGSLGIYGQLRAHVVPHSRPRRHLARRYAGGARRACLHFWNQTPDRSRRRLAVQGAPYRRAWLGAHATVVRGRMTLRGCEYLFYGSRNLRVQVKAGERAGLSRCWPCSVASAPIRRGYANGPKPSGERALLRRLERTGQ